jgi:hypothetical protein
MAEENLTVVAAQPRTEPALKKLARAYIALARQRHEAASSATSAEGVATSPKGVAS